MTDAAKKAKTTTAAPPPDEEANEAAVERVVYADYLVTKADVQANPRRRRARGNLTKEEYDYLASLIAERNAPRELVLFDNYSVQPKSGLRGGLYLYDLDARVGSSPPLSGKLFSHVMMLEVRVAYELTERLIVEALDQLRKALSSASRPWRLATHLREREARAEWDCSIGYHGAFVSVLREENAYEAPTYRIAVHSNAGAAGRDLYEALIKPGTLTYRQLIDSREFAAVRNYSRRNAQRLLYLAAEALGAACYTEEDSMAYAAPMRAAPLLARPDYASIEFNTLERIQIEGRDSVAFYSDCAPLRPGQARLPYLVDPLRGMVVYSRPFRGGANMGGEYRAFPVCTGPSKSAEQCESKKRSLANKTNATHIRSIVTTMDNSDPLANPRLYRYAPYEGRERLHLEALGASGTRAWLKPVRMIIAPVEK